MIALCLYPIVLFAVTFKRKKLWSQLIAIALGCAFVQGLGLFIYEESTGNKFEKYSDCLPGFQINYRLLPGHTGSVELQAIFYMLPLINFMFLNSCSFTLAMHCELKRKDENGTVGFRCLTLAALTTYGFYILGYLLANLTTPRDSSYSIPLLL